MYVAVVPNRGSRPAILLRESYRDGAKVRNRTLKNLSDWPPERIVLLRAVLRGDSLVPAGAGLEIVRACRMATCWRRWAWPGGSGSIPGARPGPSCRAARSGGGGWPWR